MLIMMRRVALVLSSALLSSDFCSDETDNSPPLQLHTLKEFEQVRTFILNSIQFKMTLPISGISTVKCSTVPSSGITPRDS